ATDSFNTVGAYISEFEWNDRGSGYFPVPVRSYCRHYVPGNIDGHRFFGDKMFAAEIELISRFHVRWRNRERSCGHQLVRCVLCLSNSSIRSSGVYRIDRLWKGRGDGECSADLSGGGGCGRCAQSSGRASQPKHYGAVWIVILTFKRKAD